MKTMLLALAIIVTTIGTASVSMAQTFEFELEQTTGPRGMAVQGYVHNALPWRITNVRLQVDSIDANGTLVASAPGWVVGDVAAGGRGYFYVPVSTLAASYRASVQRFDKVMLEAAPQAP